MCSSDLLRKARRTVFSEPQVDIVWDEMVPAAGDCPQWSLAVEPLPGQFDQRADSAAQCIQLMTGGERPLVRTATEYWFESAGEGPFPFTGENQEKIRRHLINPVESREASLDKPGTLVQEHPVPDHVETVSGFTAMDEASLAALLERLGLAMDLDDLKFLQAYFRDTEQRDPTITEVRVVDTYWSDQIGRASCRERV